MKRQRIVIREPEGVYPLAPYAHAVRVGQTIYVSAQVPLDEKEQSVGVGDFRAQAERTYANLLAVLKASGAEPRHVVKIMTYLTDAANQPILREVRKAALGDTRPALSMAVVKELQRPEFMIAVDAIAVVHDAEDA
jgi:enamine deaminase RidA (YjgF/YER057c/UK114 family)